MSTAAPEQPGILVSFARELRARGLTVGTAHIVTFSRAVAALGSDDLADIYWSGRACLVSARQDIPTYDAAFRDFFLGREAEQHGRDLTTDPTSSSASNDEAPERIEVGIGEAADPAAPEDEAGESDQQILGAVASPGERLRARSFAEWTAEETAELAAAVAAIEIKVARRKTRRLRPSSAPGRLDLGRSVRRSIRNEGEVIERLWRRRARRRRRLVLLIDVSGSMSTHSRALLHLGYGLVNGDQPSEVFCFGTRLTRVTDLLRGRDPNLAVDRASDAVDDWSGGTRIGASLARFLTGRPGSQVARGAVVLVASDGLEVGDPEVLARQIGRLARLAHSVVWLNPLKADPDYQPLARGMAVSLPHIDHLVAADSLLDLDRVAALIPKLA